MRGDWKWRSDWWALFCGCAGMCGGILVHSDESCACSPHLVIYWFVATVIPHPPTPHQHGLDFCSALWWPKPFPAVDRLELWCFMKRNCFTLWTRMPLPETGSHDKVWRLRPITVNWCVVRLDRTRRSDEVWQWCDFSCTYFTALTPPTCTPEGTRRQAWAVRI